MFLDPFFFNFPVAGDPIGLADYFNGTGKQHAAGILGGILAGAAFLTGMLALGAPCSVRTAAMPSYALSQGGPVLAVVWGLFVWREFKGAASGARLLFCSCGSCWRRDRVAGGGAALKCPPRAAGAERLNW